MDIARRKCAEYYRQLYPDIRKAGLAGNGLAGSRYQYAVLAYHDGSRIYHSLYAESAFSSF